MSEELMEARLSFLVFQYNEKVDIRFGLRDKHCRTLPWQEAMLNTRFAGLFDSLPFGALDEAHLADNPYALPSLFPLYDPRSWEPFGFAYLHNERNVRDHRIAKALIDGDTDAAAAIAAEPDAAITDASAAEPKRQRLAVDDDAASDADAAAAPSDGAASSAVATLPPTKRAGGLRASGAKKGRATDAATATPITPLYVSEVRLLAQSLTAARAECRADSSMKVYNRAAELYLEGVTAAHLGESPPTDLRNARTTGGLIKKAVQATHKSAQAVARERERTDGEAAAGDLLAELAAAAAADDDVDGAADAKPAKRRKKEGGAALTGVQKQQRLAALAKGIVRGTDGADGEPKAPRVLTLSELKLDPLPAALTSHVLLQYVYTAGFKPLDLAGGKAKSDLARHLVGFLESKKATEAQWSAAAAKLEPR
jgi:hypothetical protein